MEKRNPAPTPFVMLQVYGLTTMVSRTEIPITGWPHSMSSTNVIMKQPTITRTGAVASGGITPDGGDRKRHSRSRIPTTTAVTGFAAASPRSLPAAPGPPGSR